VIFEEYDEHWTRSFNQEHVEPASVVIQKTKDGYILVKSRYGADDSRIKVAECILQLADTIEILEQN